MDFKSDHRSRSSSIDDGYEHWHAREWVEYLRIDEINYHMEFTVCN